MQLASFQVENDYLCKHKNYFGRLKMLVKEETCTCVATILIAIWESLNCSKDLGLLWL